MEARNRLRLAGRQAKPARRPGVDQQGPADRPVLAEILPRRGSRQHQAVRRRQGGVGIARQNRIGHDLEEVGVGPGDPVVGRLVADLQDALRRGDAGGRLDLGEIQLHPGRRRRLDHIDGPQLLARQEQVKIEPVDLFMAGNEPVESVFVADVEADQDRSRKTDGQPQDGDGRIEAVAADVAQGCRQVVAEHRTCSPIRSGGRRRAWPGRRGWRGTIR